MLYLHSAYVDLQIGMDAQLKCLCGPDSELFAIHSTSKPPEEMCLPEYVMYNSFFPYYCKLRNVI